MFSTISFNDLLSPITNLGLGHLILLGLGFTILCYILTSLQSWHRLRNFPAPSFIASFSYLWLAKTTYSGRQYWVHRSLHKKYGTMVRIGPNEILTNDPEIIKKVSSARSSYKRGRWYQTGRFNPYHENLLSILEPAAHAKAKARTGPAYSGREMEGGVEAGLNEQLHALIAVLGRNYIACSEHSSQPLLDLGPISVYFTLDVITRLAFGREFGYLKDETDHFNFLGSLKNLWPIMSTSADVPWIRRVLFSKVFLKMFGPKTTDKTGFGALMRVAEHHVGKRFAPGAEQKSDMLGSLIRRGLNQQECEVEGLLMLIGGGESTASAIRSTLIHTITTPSVYQKLKKEIQLAVSEGRVSNPITFEEAKRLPYLQAVIYEGIRMRPPLLGLFPKIVPKGGDEFQGKHIPAGTSICMNTSSLLCSTSLFGADADVFTPERFMRLDKAKRSEMERNVELAFGYGQWMCAGKTLAFMELNKVVFEVLRAFDLQLVNPAKSCDTQSYGVFLESNMLVKVTKSAN